MMPLGNLQITKAINSYGAEALAGHSAAVSIEGLVHSVVTGFGSAAMTFVGQNIGAGRPDRVKKALGICLFYCVTIAGSLGVLTYLMGAFWLKIVVGQSASVAVEYGMLRLRYVILFEFIYATNTVLGWALKAFGYPMLTSVTNIFFTLGFRVFWMTFIYPLSPQFSTIMLCYTLSWSLNMVFYVAIAAVVSTRYFKTGICKKI